MNWINLQKKTWGFKPKNPTQLYFEEAERHFNKSMKYLDAMKKDLKKAVSEAMECKILKNGDVQNLLKLNDEIEAMRRKIIESYNKRKGEMWK